MLDKVHIGEYDYTIEETERIFASDGEFASGLVTYADALIQLSKEEHPQFRSQTLLHEILHVILNQAGFEDHSEAVIEALSYGLIQVIRENPQLIEFIRGTSTNVASFVWPSPNESGTISSQPYKITYNPS